MNDHIKLVAKNNNLNSNQVKLCINNVVGITPALLEEWLSRQSHQTFLLLTSSQKILNLNKKIIEEYSLKIKSSIKKRLSPSVLRFYETGNGVNNVNVVDDCISQLNEVLI